MTILNEFNNLLHEAITKLPTIEDADLAKSAFSLMKYNNGLYKSDKQGWFIKSKVKKGKLTPKSDAPDGAIGVIEDKFNPTYGIQWKYILDDKGVLQQIKEKWKLKKGKTREELNREWKSMTFKQREQSAGLEQEEMQDEWVHKYRTVTWQREGV